MAKRKKPSIPDCPTMVMPIHIQKAYKMQFLGDGRHRATYRPKGRGIVVKVPLSEQGLKANKSEAKLFSLYIKNKLGKRRVPYFKGKFAFRSSHHYARCRMLKNGWLVMEYLEVLCSPDTIGEVSNLPAWTDAIDCSQVGRNKRGKIVAYDYADEPRYE